MKYKSNIKIRSRSCHRRSPSRRNRLVDAYMLYRNHSQKNRFKKSSYKPKDNCKSKHYKSVFRASTPTKMEKYP